MGIRVSAGTRPQPDACFVGASCAHAILTVRCGVYRCPFSGMEHCFKRVEAERRAKELEAKSQEMKK